MSYVLAKYPASFGPCPENLIEVNFIGNGLNCLEEDIQHRTTFRLWYGYCSVLLLRSTVREGTKKFQIKIRLP